MPRKNGTPGLPLDDKNRPVVVLRQGKIVGLELEAGYPQILEAFRGVPYAQSTGGERRFMDPLPVNASDEVFDASLFGDVCPAGPATSGAQSEDCLNANIYRPKEKGGNLRLPVVVHFHGGSFNFGAGDSSRSLSHFVAWSMEPMIAVGFNYRVGAFGFLSSKIMAKAGLLNAGLKDQVLLMEWVKENIAAFGGDPDNVTLMGSSAGAHSIGHHLLHKPDIAPPFHRAILESGAPTARAVYSYSNPLHEKQFRDFLQKLNLASTPEKDLLPALRKISTSEFKKASEAIFNKYNPSLRWPFQPVIDGPGGLIPVAPIHSLKAGKFHKVPILTGFNTNEGAMFVPKSAETGKQFTEFFRNLLPGLRELDLEKLNELYPDPNLDEESKYLETREGLGKQFLRLEQAYGQFAYVAPVRQTARYFSDVKGDGIFGHDGPEVYLYHFAARSSVKGGADHGSHIPWVNYVPERRDKGGVVDEISGCMHAYWTSFVTSGDPNAVEGMWAGRAKWPVYQGGSDEARVLVFGEGNDELAGGHREGVGVQVRDDGFAAEESRFWWGRTELFEF
ncbi:putative extracellular lipase [Mollisia scopiformis]|uniref:Carboxylic ester hydrolase n=1 Tax=Mollisia scopiformis TaxID=149040 RepID=A0A194XDX4_MOLSC|nr:putative extracellular lipase [Mollisia scopiformis]KUJ18351.1 putative extracellular lipase [Mollisia scopiformis]